MKKFFLIAGLSIFGIGTSQAFAQTYDSIPALLTNATKEITIGLNNHEDKNILKFGPMDTWNAYNPSYMGKYKAFGHYVNYDVLDNDTRSNDLNNITVTFSNDQYYLNQGSQKIKMKHNIGTKKDEFQYYVASLNGSDYILRIQKDFIQKTHI